MEILTFVPWAGIWPLLLLVKQAMDCSAAFHILKDFKKTQTKQQQQLPPPQLKPNQTKKPHTGKNTFLANANVLEVLYIWMLNVVGSFRFGTCTCLDLICQWT